MASLVDRLLRRRRQRTVAPAVRPGDGVGYPLPYTPGERIKVSNEYLVACKSLSPFSGAYRLNDATVIKTGDGIRMAEAATMRLVKHHTSIPVPTVLDAYVQESDGRGVIIMEYISGERLDTAWALCDDEQKQHLVAQLKGYLSELRAIPNRVLELPEGHIGAVDGSCCNDQFFTDDDKRGPYKTVQDFHDSIAKIVLKRSDNTWSRMIASFLASLNDCQTTLTHNDLAPRNILVRDSNIVAILDWELSGVFPDYWEYVKAHYWADWDSDWISDKLPDQVLDPKLKELAYLLHVRDALR